MASPSWVILGRIARVSDTDDLPISYDDLSLALAAPQGVTSPRVSTADELPISFDDLSLALAAPQGVTSPRVSTADELPISFDDLSLAHAAPQGVTSPRVSTADELRFSFDDLSLALAAPQCVTSPRVSTADDLPISNDDLFLALAEPPGVTIPLMSAADKLLISYDDLSLPLPVPPSLTIPLVSAADKLPISYDNLSLPHAATPGVTIPQVSAAEELPSNYDDLSLALAAPPGVTILTVAQRICPDPTIQTNLPSVIAVDPSGDHSGLFLLSATQGRPTDPLVIDQPDSELDLWRELLPSYFVCYASQATSVRLPDPESPILNRGNLGFLISPRGDGYYRVAEIKMIPGSDSATLLCFSSETGEWDEKRLQCPLPDRPWRGDAVISHDGRLWLLDLSLGLLTYDPFADAPALRFVQLPEGKVLPYTRICNGTELHDYQVLDHDYKELDKYRCVKVSDGKLRFMEMTSGPLQSSPRVAGERVPRVRPGAPSISMWTLADPEAEEWTLEYEASFSEIWADESYKAAGLPEKAPVLALVHPRNPDVVYFFLEEYLFGVDLRAKRVVECDVYELVAPPKNMVSSSSVHAWELPPSFSKVSTAESTNGLKTTEESVPSASLPSPVGNK